MRDRPLHTLAFAATVCAVCAIAVSTTAVRLRPRIEANKVADRHSKVLAAAGLIAVDQSIDPAQIHALFEERVTAQVVELENGHLSAEDERSRLLLNQTRPAPDNAAGLVRLGTHRLVYRVRRDGAADALILPVDGKGLWSTLRGYLALDTADLQTVVGLVFYDHAETPGLGGEIDNPRWTAQWRGRSAFDDSSQPALHVARGPVGPPSSYPHGVDALSGATITSRGVTNMLQFWLGRHGYGPMLNKLKEGRHR